MSPASLRAPILLAALCGLLAGPAFAQTKKAAADSTESIAIVKTNRGDIVLRFFPDVAPEHVRNFLAHGKSGLYKGCLFHKVIAGFMIQTGDPNTKDADPANDGKGGYSYKGPGTHLKAEFNDRSHRRGILSMAREDDPNSAGSQFFICHRDAPYLDGKYTIFGEVIAGLDVVDKIASARCDARDRPLTVERIEDVLIEEWPTRRVEESKAAMETKAVAPEVVAPKKP